MKISGEERNIPLAVDYVREALTKRRIHSRATTRALLSVEELLVVTIAHLQKPGSSVSVRVVSLLGTTEVRIISRGSAFDSAAIRNTGAFRLDEDADEMENAVLRSLFERTGRPPVQTPRRFSQCAYCSDRTPLRFFWSALCGQRQYPACL